MKELVLAAALLCTSTCTVLGQNQDCDCAKELDFASTQLQSVPSYKSQIKDKQAAQAFLNKIKDEAKQDPRAALNCSYYLAKYLRIVRDRHLSVSTSRAEVDYAKYDHTVPGDRAALEKQARDGSDELTGLYNLMDEYEVAVVPDVQVPGRYLGVILESTTENWKPNMVKFVLDKTADGIDGRFYAADFSPAYRSIQLQNGRLYPERWVRADKAAEYTTDPYALGDDLFEYKSLGPDTHYIRLGSFSGSNSNYAAAKKLQQEMMDKIKGGKVIVDLRNNGGGGSRTSDLFLDFLKKNKENLRVAVLQNYACGSDCEQFLLKLKAQQQVETFGENTYGAVAYGFGNRSMRQEATPCYGFTLNLSQKKFEQYLDHEVTGVVPDHYLDFKKDWVEQVREAL